MYIIVGEFFCGVLRYLSCKVGQPRSRANGCTSPGTLVPAGSLRNVCVRQKQHTKMNWTEENAKHIKIWTANCFVTTTAAILNSRVFPWTCATWHSTSLWSCVLYSPSSSTLFIVTGKNAHSFELILNLPVSWQMNLKLANDWKTIGIIGRKPVIIILAGNTTLRSPRAEFLCAIYGALPLYQL